MDGTMGELCLGGLYTTPRYNVQGWTARTVLLEHAAPVILNPASVKELKKWFKIKDNLFEGLPFPVARGRGRHP